LNATIIPKTDNSDSNKSLHNNEQMTNNDGGDPYLGFVDVLVLVF
jgi:hypothetical protein